MDLQTVAAKTGLPVRLIRYVLDHGLLPGGRVSRILTAKGQPRSLTDHEAFAVAIAGSLLEVGLRRGTVSRYLAPLIELRISLIDGLGDYVLGVIYSTRFPAIVRFAEESLVRVIHRDKDSGWLPPPKDPTSEPRVVVEVDLAVLRSLLKSNSVGPEGKK